MDRETQADYVDRVVTALAPSLLVYANQCDRLGLWAPAPADLARTIADEWLATREAQDCPPNLRLDG